MALAEKPVTGMRDITPAEMQIHEYVMNQIRETYKSFEFTQIETPCVEHIGNLTSKQGGDNEKLIFKILKRGSKSNPEEAKEEDDLVDSGLCYDLILPLFCYYTSNIANLPSSFKAPQMGSAWRAGRPQRGRFHQFVRCDTDVLRDATSLAEIELILVTTVVLGRICPDSGFTVCISDRGILRDVALYCGFPEESMGQVFITLNKVDKTGYEGVGKKLLGSDYCLENISKYLDMLKNITKNSVEVRALGRMLSEVMSANVSEGLAHIMDMVAEVVEADFDLEFDPTLVRGMSHYAGTILEASMEGFGGSVADGGRYDRMIGKLTGMKTSAYGFSIGSECIITIPMNNGFTVSGAPASRASLFERGVDSVRLAVIICEATKERKKGIRVLAAQINKNEKFQEGQLGREGYTGFRGSYKGSLKN